MGREGRSGAAAAGAVGPCVSVWPRQIGRRAARRPGSATLLSRVREAASAMSVEGLHMALDKLLTLKLLGRSGIDTNSKLRERSF